MSEENKKTETAVEEETVQQDTEVKEAKVEETPEVSEVDRLKKENEDLKEQVDKLKNAYAMAYADTENTRKRLQKDFEARSMYHIQPFALEVLPVLDNCERALAQATSDDAYRKGVEMIYNQLKSALEKEGITEIDALNQPFDGNWHQALMSEHRDDVEPGTVIEVLQKGYKLKDRILRAAMVKVSE